MKKIHLSSIHNILSKSINRPGMQVDTLYKQHPHPIQYELYESLLNSDEMIDMSNKTFIKLKETYYKTDAYIKFEEAHYNINYLKTLFKEETNTIKLSIYKLLVDTVSLTYQQITNEMIRLYQTKLDIKQVSHYCMELVKIKLIVSNQSNTIEKINSLNHIAMAYHDKENDNEIQEQIIRRNIHFDQSYCHFPQQILTLRENEAMSENKFFLSNRFAYVIDGCEIKNNIIFHLLLNKEKGLTANEICLLCDFTGREKTLNKIISILETKKLITHSVVREGKKLEFVYITCEGVQIDKKIEYYAEYYRNHSHIKSNNNSTLQLREDKSIQQHSIVSESSSSLKSIHNNNNLDEKLDEQQSPNDQSCPQLPQTIINNEYEDLNKTDFQYILSITKNDTTITYTHKERCKIILAYLSSSSLVNKYFSTSAFNRFIFILNQLNEYKVLSLIDIKRLILKILEHDKGFEIDRKTLKRILETLQNLKLIKLIYLDLIMKNLQQSYLNERKEIVQEKIIALRRDQDENNEALLKDVSERVKPPKKSMIQKALQKTMKKESKIQEMGIGIQALAISQYERNVGVFVKKMMKMVKEDNKKSFAMKFIIKMKRLYSIKTNSSTIFENKEYSMEYNANRMKLFKIYEETSQRKIIVPQYYIDKIVKDNNVDKRVNYENLKDYYDYVIKSKNVIKETFQGNIKKTKENDNVAEEEENEDDQIKEDEVISKKEEKDISLYLKKKRLLEDYPEIHKSRYDFKKWNKLIDVYLLLKEIYLYPGITFKKLKKMIHIANDLDGAEAELLQYLQKLRIIIIQNTQIKDRSITDTTSFFIDSNFSLFIDI